MTSNDSIIIISIEIFILLFGMADFLLSLYPLLVVFITKTVPRRL